MSKALVVLSGGQDSTTCLFMAVRAYDEVHAITFDYGQRHAVEIDAAIRIATMAGVASHEVICVPDILKSHSFLTDKTKIAEEFDTFDAMEHHNLFKENKLDSSFVPMRNTLFLTIAANWALALGCEAIITGVTAADFAEYGEFSWEWLGGFVDAEGCFSTVNGNGYRLSISQKDPALLHRIGEWVKRQYPDFTYSIHVRKSDQCAEMTIGKLAYQKIAGDLSPHLHSDWRRGQAEQRGALVLPEASLNDAYVTGFWEGDGSCYSAFTTIRKKYITAMFTFDFYQKDPKVLELIQVYLRAGSLRPDKDIWKLTVSDGPVRAKLLSRMRKHFCVLGSFEKVDWYRHKIGMLAGGFNPPYPDCSPDFIFTYQKALDESIRSPSQGKLEIVTPVMYYTKAESVVLAASLGPECMDALAYSHTCYNGSVPPCGKCHACLLREKGFAEAGIADPLVVRVGSNHVRD